MNYIYSAGKGFLRVFGIGLTPPLTNQEIIANDVGMLIGSVVKSIPDILGHSIASIEDAVTIAQSVYDLAHDVNIVGHGYGVLNDVE